MVAAEKNVDLPTLGFPTIPMSIFSPPIDKEAWVKNDCLRNGNVISSLEPFPQTSSPLWEGDLGSFDQGF
jgi:hypothetical protein